MPSAIEHLTALPPPSAWRLSYRGVFIVCVVTFLAALAPPALAQRNQATRKPPAQVTVRDKWAVIVGLNKYQDQNIPSLKHTTANLAILNKVLQDPNTGRFAADHICALFDAKATQANIEDTITQAWLVKKALPADLIVVYLCGRAIFTDSDAVFCAFDTLKNAPDNTGVSVKALLGELRRRTQCRNILCLLDLSPCSDEKVTPTSKDVWRTIADTDKVTVLAASLPGYPSLTSNYMGASLFTNYFAEGLRTGGGAMNLETIAQFVCQSAETEASNQMHKEQHPQYIPPADYKEIGTLVPGLPSKNYSAQSKLNFGHPLDELALSRPDLMPHGPQAVRAKHDDDEEQDDSDFGNVDFSLYMTKMKKDIQSKWKPPRGLEQRKVVALFSINRDGSITDPSIIESSGVESIDKSALEALHDASPLQALPRGAPRSVQIRYQFDWKVSQK